MAHGDVHDQIADDYLAKYDRELSVPAIQKIRKWPFLQELGYNGQLKHLKKDFHGLRDFFKQMDKYSSSHIILKIAWKLIKMIVPKNAEIQALLTTLPGMGEVGKLFRSIPGFSKVFALSPEELKDPAKTKQKTGNFI